MSSPLSYPRYKNKTRWPVSRVLSLRQAALDGHSSGTPVAGRLLQPTRMVTRKPPADNAETSGRPFLLGFAPGGVYHASRIAEGPVRSYRTLSPFPDGLRDQEVCFLWHFP